MSLATLTSLTAWREEGRRCPLVVPYDAHGTGLSGTTKSIFRIRISNSECTSAFSRREVARGLGVVVPPRRREQGMPDARCTRGPVCQLGKEIAHEHTGQRRTSDIPCAMVLRLISRSPRSIGLFSPPSPHGLHANPVGLSRLRKDLTPTSEASGPHDFAVRFDTARQHVLKTAHGVYPALQSFSAHDAVASTASHPNVR